jgi:hypothetical protein
LFPMFFAASTRLCSVCLAFCCSACFSVTTFRCTFCCFGSVNDFVLQNPDQKNETNVNRTIVLIIGTTAFFIVEIRT